MRHPHLFAALGTALALSLSPPVVQAAEPAAPTPGAKWAPKVMIVAMFAPEAKLWQERLGPWRSIRVPGLAANYPAVQCNRQQVCLMTLGMGHTNAAASMMAVAFSPAFDLRKTYFLIAGIAGINPELGTLGSVAWARYLVDYGLQWELDAREAPTTWPSGLLGINTKGPDEKPPLDYRTEVFQLDEALLQKALALSRGVALSDGAQAQAARAKFSTAPANQPPSVLQCDTLAGDTWFSGKYLSERATQWTRVLTDGKGVYCTTQQEDNATYEAIKRAAAAGRADVKRVAVLRAGSDFDRPYSGQSAADNLLGYADQGGFDISLENLYRAGLPLVKDITAHWQIWKTGTPKP